VEDRVALGEHAGEPRSQDAHIEQVAHANAGAPGPVGVGSRCRAVIELRRSRASAAPSGRRAA
jgi:hypothetical protein